MGRLIDADDLIEEINKKMPQGSARGVFKAFIDEQPTAYDLENVVAELKKRKGNVIIDGKIMYQENYFIDIDSAIDIVKAGGVDD